jgi:xylulokinase
MTICKYYCSAKLFCMPIFLLGLDIGSSSVKASVVDVESGKTISVAQSPSDELSMIAVKPQWAEQDPETWWHHAKESIRLCLTKGKIQSRNIVSIGISYQMHGLVLVDRDQKVLRPSIIWCDSRAVEIGEKAFQDLGEEYCLSHFLNSPGNFTASKLRWVQQNEPDVFKRIHKAVLPGDFIAMKLTGEIITTDTGLSEGIFWDYETQGISDNLLAYYQIPKSLLPDYQNVFSHQGTVKKAVAGELGLNDKVTVSYRAGDQPNNAFSLNVLNNGETAATAGTSGVIYSVTNKNAYDPKSRVNTFIHVNNTAANLSNGVLLCINGTGILNSWMRKTMKAGSLGYDYQQMNEISRSAPIGSEKLIVLPFGNGAERVLQNQTINASVLGLDFNRHTQAHLLRAGQEGIVFALKYGFEVLQSMGLKTSVIRAGYANMFLSPIFREAFVNTIDVPLQLFNTDGATGAAIGAGVGANLFSIKDAFKGLSVIDELLPDPSIREQYQHAYARWKLCLEEQLNRLTENN